MGEAAILALPPAIAAALIPILDYKQMAERFTLHPQNYPPKTFGHTDLYS